MTSGSHNGEPYNFYGSLVNIIKVQFIRGFRVILFKCQWYNIDTKGKKIIQDFLLTSVNVNNRWYDSNPYLLTTQDEDDDEYKHESDSSIWPIKDDNDETTIPLCKEDIDPESMDVNVEV